jgi:SAM-dependent methyltransferase
MIYTHHVRSVEAKTLFYQRLAEQRQDTTSCLNPAHYGLANQIKSCRLYDRVLMRIREWWPRGDVHLVDVGCAGGLFLLAAQVVDDGYNVGVPPRFKVRGVSIDPREQRDTAGNVGCPVETPERAAEAWPAWADVVTVLNTLEHVNEPRHLLACIKQTLGPGGRLVIDVPNNYVLVRRAALRGRWPSLDISEHINNFVPPTLDRLLTTTGFTRVERLPGLLRGVESLGRKPGVSQMARWSAARVLMAATGGAVQAFPHMTMAYQRRG